MGFMDYFRGMQGLDPEEKRRRRMGGLAAMAQAMAQPSYHRAGMLGPMLLAGGGAAIANRRYEEDAYEKRQQEEEERARREEIEAAEREARERMRTLQEEAARLRIEDARGDLEAERNDREALESYREKIRAAGYDPYDPVEVKIYEETMLSERGPKDPMDELQLRERRLRIQGLEQALNEEEEPDEPTIYRSGSGYGTIGPDPSAPGGLRYQPIPGTPEPQDDDPTKWILGRVAELRKPPDNAYAMPNWQPPSFQEAADLATKEWEVAQRSKERFERQRREAEEERYLQQQMNRFRPPRPEAGTEIAGITVPSKDEAVPSTPGRVRYGAGTGEPGTPTDPQIERIVARLRPEIQDAVRQRIQDALSQGESIASIMAELQSAMGGGF